MLISALAAASALPVATVKFYLREGLLPPGRATSATRAVYDQSHLARLRLVRALTDVAGLPLARVREVLQQLDAPQPSFHHLLGVAHLASFGPAPTGEVDLARAREVVAAVGWQVDEHSPALGRLAQALDAVDAAGVAFPAERLAAYAAAAHKVAASDVASVPQGSPSDAARYVVLGTLLLEPVLLALRRLAQEDVSTRRFLGRAPADQDDADDHEQQAAGSQQGPDQGW